MTTARDIIRGCFRLSIVAAALAAAYSAYQTWQSYTEAYQANYELVRTLECGSRIDEATLKPYENAFGLVDLSKVFCSHGQFLASYEELRAAREGRLSEQSPPCTTRI